MSRIFFQNNEAVSPVAVSSPEEFVRLLKEYKEVFGRPTNAYYGPDRTVLFEHDFVLAYSSPLYSEGPDRPVTVKLWPEEGSNHLREENLRQEVTDAFREAEFDYVALNPLEDRGIDTMLFDGDYA